MRKPNRQSRILRLCKLKKSPDFFEIGRLESVEKVDTLLDGNAVRSKIKDFRTALYPRQYHPCTLEKPLVKRLFAYKVFFRRTCRRKNKIRLTAAEKLNLRFIDRLKSPDFFEIGRLLFLNYPSKVSLTSITAKPTSRA